MEGKKSTVRPNGTDSARVIQVIETKSNRGKGTLDDLSRQVVQYWSLEGQLLAERDSHTTKNEQVTVIQEICRFQILRKRNWCAGKKT